MVESRELHIRYSSEAGNENAERAAVSPHPESAAWKAHLLHCLLDLLLDTLSGKAREVRCAGDDGSPGIGFDLEIEAGGKSHPAERPEPIFAHPLGGLAHGAYDALLEVEATVERVVPPSLRRRKRYRVDGIIPTRKIFVERRSEFDYSVPSVSLNIAA